MEAVKINGSQRSRYNSALHAQFNDHIYGIVNDSATAKVKIPATLITQWRTAIDIEIDINREVHASATTVIMAEKDTERNDLITHLFEEIRNQCRSPFPTNKEAASQLIIYVDKYKGVQHEASDVKTMHIKGFVLDVRSGINAVHLTMLGLTDIVTMIEESNNEYEGLKASRTAERASKTLPTSAVARRETDTLYGQVCQIVEVSFMLSTDADEKQDIINLVTRMNQYIDETKATYNQMAASGSATPEDDGDQPETPDEGDENNDQPDTALA